MRIAAANCSIPFLRPSSLRIKLRSICLLRTVGFGRPRYGPSSPAEHYSIESAQRILLPLVLLLFYLGQCLWFIKTQSFTCDEPTHIRAGMEAVRNGRFVVNDQPPLSRLLFGLILRDPKWQILTTQVPGAAIVNSVRPDAEAMAWRVRLANTAMGLVLALLLWLSARRLFSEGAAIVALALFAFSSEAIAHFSLATTDGVGALLVFATAIQAMEWLEKPSWPRTLLLAAIMGALLLGKFYTAPIFLLGLALVIFCGWRPDKIPKIIVLIIIVFFTVWSGYLFHVSQVKFHQGKLIITFPNREPQIRNFEKHPNLDLSLYVPAGEYFEGLRDLVFHNHRGHRAFFLGRVSPRGGWKLYYPAAMFLKWPTLVLIMFLTVVILMLKRKIVIPRKLALMALFPLVFLGFAIFSKINIGVRHVLPVYPFVVLFCAALWQWARPNRVWRWALYAAITLNAADCLRCGPDYLSYFAPFVNPENSYQLLADSNLDWGQGLLALRKYEAEHPREEVYLTCFGCIDPMIYGFKTRFFGERQRVSGTVVVSASQLAGIVLDDPNAFHWLLWYPRVAILDRCMYVFKVPTSSPKVSRLLRLTYVNDEPASDEPKAR